MIFDYVDVSGSFSKKAGDRLQHWLPIKIDILKSDLKDSGWKFVTYEDISEHYRNWYRILCSRIERHEAQIIGSHGRDWYDYVHSFYAYVLSLIERGVLGGAIIWAEFI
jgi:cyclopropane fatty-acyl-phospholipid synthase-like methyltransferase